MVEELRRALLAQAYLFDDPMAYRAGVEDALQVLLETDLLRPLGSSDAQGVPA